MSSRRSILGVWVIERSTGRNLVARSYTGIKVDMDLIAPFLSATHTFIDRAANEELQTIDTENSRYVWAGNEHLLLVLVVSKTARLSHMRFLLRYALDEFMKRMIPRNKDLSMVLDEWKGTPETFADFGKFLDELIEQYEITDEKLVAGKAMDCLEVYNHLFRELMRIDIDKRSRTALVKKIRKAIQPISERFPFLSKVPVDGAGIEVLEVNVVDTETDYKTLRIALEELFSVVAKTIRENVKPTAYQDVLFNHVMLYVKNDLQRLQTYAILDDVVRHLF